MKVIYKYTVPFKEIATISMHSGAKVIRVDGVEGQIYLWAVVDTSEKLTDHKFYLFKTGMEMPDDIGSYIYHGCGAIFIGMELMMYVYSKPTDVYPETKEMTKWEGFPNV